MGDALLLEGIRVVEVATFVLGPAAGTVLADFGAEVIHVERPGIGDVYRHLNTLKPLPESDVDYPWILTSRNKKSIALDLKTESGRAVVRDLVSGADIFITNYQPSVLEALEMRWEDLGPLNSRLIYAHATGYGDAGEEVEKPGYDATAWWARSGLMDAVRPTGAELGLATAGMGDHPSAMALFAAIALALFDRERSGKGRRVTTSLLANGAWANGVYLQAALCGAKPYRAPTRDTHPNALVCAYTCSDARSFYLAMVTEAAEWPRFTDAVGRPELRDDPRFSELESRRTNSVALMRILEEIFASETLGHWRDRLNRFAVTFGSVARTEELPDDAQMNANGIFPAIEGDPDGYRTVDSPIHLDGVAKRRPHRAPNLGEHDVEVLESLGYSPEKIEALRASGALSGAPTCA
jgi:crotonobetainyl-CoA:carnitine CoA-transferase CaiB-like acyl-CoA transferase